MRLGLTFSALLFWTTRVSNKNLTAYVALLCVLSRRNKMKRFQDGLLDQKYHIFYDLRLRRILYQSKEGVHS